MRMQSLEEQNLVLVLRYLDGLETPDHHRKTQKHTETTNQLLELGGTQFPVTPIRSIRTLRLQLTQFNSDEEKSALVETMITS